MLNKPRCQKAQNIPGKQAIYCEGRVLCAHQYHCPQTRRYENTAEFAKCQRLYPATETEPATQAVRYVLNVVPEARAESEGVVTSAEAIPAPIYAKNVSPIDYGVTKIEETPAEPVDTKPETDANMEVRKEKKNGTVRNTRRRKAEKG